MGQLQGWALDTAWRALSGSPVDGGGQHTHTVAGQTTEHSLTPKGQGRFQQHIRQQMLVQMQALQALRCPLAPSCLPGC